MSMNYGDILNSRLGAFQFKKLSKVLSVSIFNSNIFDKMRSRG